MIHGLILAGLLSWYSTGTKGLYTACWQEYKGHSFKVSYLNTHIIVRCNDTGHFREMGRVLDLSKEAFRQLAPISQGVLRGATVEVIK